MRILHPDLESVECACDCPDCLDRVAAPGSPGLAWQPTPGDRAWWATQNVEGCGERELSPSDEWLELCETSDQWYARLADESR